MRSRFAALRIRPAHRDYWSSEPHPEQWLLIEWPKQEAEPAKYWLSALPASTNLSHLVRIAKQRWIIERDYQELKQELGLGHYEGRGWRGFHHHATLCIAAYGFLVAERSRFSPSARAGQVDLPVPEIPPQYKHRFDAQATGVMNREVRVFISLEDKDPQRVAVAGAGAASYLRCLTEWAGPGTIPRLSSTVMIWSAATSCKT